MLNAIKNFFEQNMFQQIDSRVTSGVASRSTTGSHEHQLRLATAALLVEMMNQDDSIQESEKQAIRDSLKESFNISDEEAVELCRLAEEEVSNATDYYQFTKLITENFSQSQKIQVIELLWRVAYADNHLDSYEEHLVRRIADLISVPHSDYIRTKLQAQNVNKTSV